MLCHLMKVVLFTVVRIYVSDIVVFRYFCAPKGELAQLARALAWHARGQGFDSPVLHKKATTISSLFYFAPAFKVMYLVW